MNGENINNNSIYSKLGLQNNDIIIKVNGKKFCSSKELKTLIQDGLSNNKLSFTVKRNKKEQVLIFFK